MKTELPPINRRLFLKNSGALVLGFSLFSMPGLPLMAGSLQSRNSINAWLRLSADGKLTVITGKMELGQGIKTALMQMAVDELDLNFNRAEIITADTKLSPDERYTAGSASIESSGRSIRMAAASAREFLLKRAASTLKTTTESLRIEDGNIIAASGARTSYWELLKDADLNAEVNPSVKLKSPDSYNWVGKAIPRMDIKTICSGGTHFVHDLRLPGMLHARILRPPSYGAKLLQLDESAATSIKGVLKICRDGSFVGVIGNDEFACIKAVNALQTGAKWEEKSIKGNEKSLQSELKEWVQSSQEVSSNGSYRNSNAATPDLKSSYFRPYHMHGSMGPSCAVAEFKDGKLQVWSHTQGPYPMRATLADLLQIPLENIHVSGMPGSGCYGHNGADDVGAEVALLAKMYPGVPIRLQWSREDEHRWEPYGSAMLMEISAKVDATGKISQWESHLWSDTHSTRPGGRAGSFLPASYLSKPFAAPTGGFSGGSYRNAQPLYKIPSQKLVVHNIKGPLRTSALRGLGAYANIFALESFMDELAILTKKNPLEFRLNNLDDFRAKEVLEKVADISGFNSFKKDGNRGLGLAFSRYKNTAAYFAVVVEVELIKTDQKIQLQKMWGVIDSGQTINPDGLKNQTEGGLIQSASWTLFEEVKFNSQGPLPGAWASYPIIRFNDVPEIQVEIIDRPKEAPLGSGEAAQGPVSAAIANAIYHACGQRLRSLPIKSESLDWNKI